MEKTKILIVDDEEDILSLLTVSLARANYQCLGALNQAEAIELVKKEHPPIVLLDIKLGGESGIDVLCKIKQIDKNVKVIMLTALQDEENIIKAKSCGADDYAPKLSDSSSMGKEVLEKISLLALKQKK